MAWSSSVGGEEPDLGTSASVLPRLDRKCQDTWHRGCFMIHLPLPQYVFRTGAGDEESVILHIRGLTYYFVRSTYYPCQCKCIIATLVRMMKMFRQEKKVNT